jgi:TRAP-type mannitol/chloroaromatic compound transport system permease large subunit
MGSLGLRPARHRLPRLHLEKLKESVFLTARTSAMVCWLFVGSYIFSSVFGYLGGTSVVEDVRQELPLNTFTFMLLAQVIIFILGLAAGVDEIVVIFVPIFLPLLDDFGVSPIFFGILIALNLQTSFLSPPVAMAAFYLKGVAPPHVRLEGHLQGCIPSSTSSSHPWPCLHLPASRPGCRDALWRHGRGRAGHPTPRRTARWRLPVRRSRRSPVNK